MTRMTFACPGTGKLLSAMTVDDSDPEIRIVVHCPKCSELHVFANGDAVERQEVAVA